MARRKKSWQEKVYIAMAIVAIIAMVGFSVLPYLSAV
jgi:hypothetical protein